MAGSSLDTLRLTPKSTTMTIDPTTLQISPPASLDGLPVELKVSILQQASDKETLHALTQSSSLFYNAYLEQRPRILSAFLSRDIEKDVMPDALAVYDAFKISFGLVKDSSKLERKEQVEAFLKEYKVRRALPAPVLDAEVGLDKLVSLARVHRVIRRISCDFVELALAQVPSNTRIQRDEERKLSSNEERRIHRSLYRFELFCTLFAEPLTVQTESEVRNSVDPMDHVLMFLSIYKTWEVEEMACIRDYIITRHIDLLLECKSELQVLHPTKDFSMDYRFVPYDIATYCMSLGLPFLQRVLQATTIASRAKVLKNHLWDGCEFLTHALNTESYDSMGFETDANTAWEAGESIEFPEGGDDLADGMNAAWPWSTGYKAEVLYFQPEKEGLRGWAYVMWDRARLERWKVVDAGIEEVERLTIEPTA